MRGRCINPECGNLGINNERYCRVCGADLDMTYRVGHVRELKLLHAVVGLLLCVVLALGYILWCQKHHGVVADTAARQLTPVAVGDADASEVVSPTIVPGVRGDEPFLNQLPAGLEQDQEIASSAEAPLPFRESPLPLLLDPRDERDRAIQRRAVPHPAPILVGHATGLPKDSVVFPNVGALTTVLSYDELNKLTDTQLCLLRNEYCVRHGYTFSSKSHPHLIKFFAEECLWYAERYRYMELVTAKELENGSRSLNLSPVEGANADMVRRIEAERGSWHIDHKGPEPLGSILKEIE